MRRRPVLQVVLCTNAKSSKEPACTSCATADTPDPVYLAPVTNPDYTSPSPTGGGELDI